MIQFSKNSGQPDAVLKSSELLNHWRALGNPIVHICQDSMDPASPYAPDKPSHDFKDEVAPLDHETIVEKRTNNAFIGTDLMQVLEGDRLNRSRGLRCSPSGLC